MIYAEDVAVVHRGRKQGRSVAEKLQIVQLTVEPGGSVAEALKRLGHTE